MSNDEEHQEKRGFKVADRRRFSESGDARPEVDEAPVPSAAPPPEPATAPGSAPEARHTGPPPADINFSTFVISLSTQALAHLGEIENPIDRQLAVDLAAAKQLIDILGLLQEKTKGNLEKTEAGLLDTMLYDLRLRYVERVRSQSPKA